MPQRRVFVTDAFGVLQDACIAAVQAVQTAQSLSPLTILVPHDSLAEHLRQAIARAGRGHLGVRFFSLADFARECAEDRLARHGWRPLPRLAAPLIMKHLLAQLGPEHLFGGLADQPGFPASVLTTLAECKDAGISVDHLQTFVTRARLTGAYRTKIESLATLYHYYQRFLTEQRLYDEQDLLDQAALECDAPPGAVFVYGFYDFSPLQRRLITAALQDRDGLVFFPWRAGQAYAHATPTLSWLRSLGLTYTPLARAAESELSRLHQSLFEEALPRVASAGAVPPSIRCLAAPSDSREAREISRTVLSLVRDHQLRFSEIGIVLRDPDRYGRLLTETFDNLDIPSWLSGGLPLLHTAAGQALHLLGRMLVEDYAPDRVFEFLTVSRPPDTTARYAQLDRWQALVRQAGIIGGVTAWQDGLARIETAYRAEARSSDHAAAELSVVRACRAFMRGLFAAAEQRPSQLSWHAWADYSLRLYRTYSSPTSHTDQIEALLLDLAQLDLTGSHQPNTEAGESNRFNTPMSSPSLEDWATAVSQALATPHPTGQTDGVFIGDLAAARGRRFRAVIIPGMLDGGFPRSVRQDPLLLDAERQHLAETLGCELAQRGQRNEEERLLFCLATQTAVEHLILSYPSHDQSSGRPQLPSWYLLRVLEAVRGRVQTFADLEAWSQRVPLAPVYAGPVQQAQDSLEFHLATVEQTPAGGDMAALGYLPLAMPAFSAAQQAVGPRLDSPRLTAFDGLLEAAQARRRLRQLFPTGVCVSPSALETYARCPFQYFLSQVLGLTPRDEAEGLAGLSPRQRGLLLHAIVSDFFSQLRRAGQLPVHGQDPQLLTQGLMHIADRHFSRFADTQPTGPSLVWELEQERLRERLIRLVYYEVADQSEFVPRAFELDFGSTPDAEQHEPAEEQFFPDRPVSFRLEDGESIRLRGRIDRIDVSSAGPQARIIDYKTGRAPRGRFAHGTALQLPLYLFAARSLRPDLVWESAGYVGLGQRVHTPAPAFNSETWPEAAGVLRQILTIVLKGIRSGCFFPHPDTCRPCPFPDICGSQVEQRMRHKRHDPRWAVLRQLGAID